MPEQPIRVKMLNVQLSNERISTLLQSDINTDILLIQEPWMGTVATLRSDTTPEGDTQIGLPHNDMWDTHLPRHTTGQRCKAAVYTRKALNRHFNVRNQLSHPLSTPNSVVVDIVEGDDILARLINLYNPPPRPTPMMTPSPSPRNTTLKYLTDHDLDDNIPTIISGDFNTHAERWSLPRTTFSSWASRLCDWMDTHGFSLLNPLLTPTRRALQSRDQDSLIDLVFANEAVCWFGHIGPVEISEAEALGSDHNAVLFSIIPSDHPSHIPSPGPTGYRADDEQHQAWSKTFAATLPYEPEACTYGPRLESETVEARLWQRLKAFDHAVDHANKTNLKPKKSPDPRGVKWWNEECTTARTLVYHAPNGEARRQAFRELRRTIKKAKRSWGHEVLNSADSAAHIWRMAKVRKGRATNIFPALRREDGSLAENPAEKLDLLQARFFPTNPLNTLPRQPDDPPPREPRQWAEVTPQEVTNALRTTTNSSAPGPSGVGYKLLKWAHATRPEALAQIYTDCLEAGIHPWRQVTVVAINKPFKPDYSKPKAYRPISLMECAGKLLEKIVAKRINNDIQTHDLLPMTQFGSRPYHSAVDAVAVLVHRIQATRAAKRAGALLLFDISGFFDNINPTRATQIFRDKGFPPGMCAWVASFLSARTATLRGGGHVSDPFEITSGTPQGSPLSPILSAMYTANLLEMTSTWSLRDLTMYVDDGAIYATSATVKGATESAAEGYAQVLNWLYRNGLTADPEKCELMTFTHSRADLKKTGQPVLGINYTDPIHGPQHIGVAKEPIRYLGLYIDPKLNWQHHVQIMANRGRSTIRGINILGNSVRGIDILSW